MPIPTVAYVDILSPSDIRVRKWWISSFALISVGLLLNFFLLLEMTSDTHVRSATAILLSYAVVTYKTLIPALLLYIPYHCGYKYPGTKWLAFILIITPLSLFKEVRLFQINAMNSAGSPSADLNALYWEAVGLIVLVGLYSVWLVMCWRLRKVNKKVHRYIKSQEPRGEHVSEHVSCETSTESESLIHA